MKHPFKKCHYLWLIARWLLVVHTIIVTYHWGWRLMAPYMVEWIELRVLNAVCWWKQGFGLPYPALGRLPFFWNPYGFVYEGICCLLPSPIHPYFAGRAVSLLSTLLILKVVALWVRYYTGKWSCGLLAAMLLLTAKPLFMFGILYRVDMLSVMLSVAGFILIFFTRYWLIGVLLMVLGFHAKLTAIAAPIASVISFWHKDRLKALLIGCSWLMLAISSLVILQTMTNGNYLYHAILGNEPSRWLKPLDMMIIRPLKSSPFWVALTLYIWRLVTTSEIKTFKPELSYLIVAWLIAGITATNPGSSWNYLLEFYVALAMLSGRLLHLVLEKCNIRTTIVALLTLHALFAIFHTSYFCAKDMAKIQGYHEEFLRAKATLGNLFANSRRVAVIGSGSAMDVALSFGVPNYTDPPSKVKDYVEKLAIDALQQGKLDLVIMAKNGLEVITYKQINKPEGGWRK